MTEHLTDTELDELLHELDDGSLKRLIVAANVEDLLRVEDRCRQRQWQWPELPEGYSWDHSTSPSSIRGPRGFSKSSGCGPRQAARIAWAHHERRPK